MCSSLTDADSRTLADAYETWMYRRSRQAGGRLAVHTHVEPETRREQV
jgi:hypothetical protein